MILRRSFFSGSFLSREQALKALDIDPAMPNLTTEDALDAFRQKAKKTHPDAGGSEREFARVREAYDALGEMLPTREELLSVRTEMIKQREESRFRQNQLK